MRTNVCILGRKHAMEKCVYARETFCPLVLNLLLVYRIWFMLFISLLSGKEKNTWTFIHIHLHLWFMVKQFAVDRPDLIWTQQVNFIGNKAVNTVRGSSSWWGSPLMKWLDKKGKHFIELAKTTRFHFDGVPGLMKEASKQWRWHCRAQTCGLVSSASWQCTFHLTLNGELCTDLLFPP